MRSTFASLVLTAALMGCATPRAVCPSGYTAAERAELFFGRNIGGAPGVSDAAWADFVDHELAPRFPDGFTVLDANGQWRDAATGAAIREPSKIVLIVHSGSDEDRKRLDAIADSYKARFHQQSVGRIVEVTCATFQ